MGEVYYDILLDFFYDLYLKTDLLLLADVFETFRTVCHNKNYYGLDPAHYYTAPGLAWSECYVNQRVGVKATQCSRVYTFIVFKRLV